ncbi:hypothetical protein [Oceanobacillus massiliensis]|uniref:hypothetical protein n=1 Tax=Oceanobacillus massiliensis TaxID=1465765 RepID=UPI000289D5AB|nr:hypothetical protein [Oceanobacillus massiliensis]
MRHPYRKLVQMELFLLLFAFLAGIAALIAGYIIILFLSIYLIVFSLICDAMILLNTRHPAEAGKQAIRAVMLFLFMTYLLFRL